MTERDRRPGATFAPAIGDAQHGGVAIPD